MPAPVALGELWALGTPGSPSLQWTQASLPADPREGLRGTGCVRGTEALGTAAGARDLTFGVGVLRELFASLEVKQNPQLEIKQSLGALPWVLRGLLRLPSPHSQVTEVSPVQGIC